MLLLLIMYAFQCCYCYCYCVVLLSSCDLILFNAIRSAVRILINFDSWQSTGKRPQLSVRSGTHWCKHHVCKYWTENGCKTQEIQKTEKITWRPFSENCISFNLIVYLIWFAFIFYRDFVFNILIWFFCSIGNLFLFYCSCCVSLVLRSIIYILFLHAFLFEILSESKNWDYSSLWR